LPGNPNAYTKPIGDAERDSQSFGYTERNTESFSYAQCDTYGDT
jgi:hypothetical protein